MLPGANELAVKKKRPEVGGAGVVYMYVGGEVEVV